MVRVREVMLLFLSLWCVILFWKKMTHVTITLRNGSWNIEDSLIVLYRAEVLQPLKCLCGSTEAAEAESVQWIEVSIKCQLEVKTVKVVQVSVETYGWRGVGVSSLWNSSSHVKVSTVKEETVQIKLLKRGEVPFQDNFRHIWNISVRPTALEMWY